MKSPLSLLVSSCLILLSTPFAVAEPLAIDASEPPAPAQDGYFQMGTARNPAGHELTVNSRSLLRDGKPWLPAMGEFHYSRCPESQWRDELLKMKAGGIDIVSTYVFWIHHEEVEGKFDWSGQRNLHNFVKLCGELGLSVVVRCGPWCHGEVRNGGLPDWLLTKGFKLRTNDPAFLDKVHVLYGEIAGQLKGLLWKEGGPVVGIQCDNEYYGPAEYLLTLKKMAREAGLDTPLYTRTGWPALKTKMPEGEMLPLYGGYAEGFWNKVLTPMPGKYWFEFMFSFVSLETETGTDQLGAQKAKVDDEASRYPYLTCEIGGGMMSSYHRRILMPPADVESVTLVKMGSGSNLPGYYMYHGGTNPEGQLSTLQESQATDYPNDLPVKTYDFQAPLGEYGQIRPHYNWFRRLHLFLQDFGPELTAMTPRLPAIRPKDKSDTDTLRWSARSNGTSGYLYVNNYQRLLPMPKKDGVQFAIHLASSDLSIPKEPITIPADSFFFWPYNFDLGNANLVYATAQPVCRVEDQGTRYVVFAETKGVPSEFVLSGKNLTVESATGAITTADDQTRVQKIQPGTDAAISIKTKDGKKTVIILLDNETSLACWKGIWKGKERIFLTKSGLILDKDTLRLNCKDTRSFQSAVEPNFAVSILPSPAIVRTGGAELVGKEDGLFRHFSIPVKLDETARAEVQSIRVADPARQILKGKKDVAEAPSDADFEKAAVWKIKIPEGKGDLLRVHYIGDAARFYVDGKLVTDNFYYGDAFEIGLKQFQPDLSKKELLLKILPLRKDAPIYLAKEAQPDFGNAESIVELKLVEIIPQQEAQFEAE